jgi:DNA-binding XRE family transcriptional regulator
MNCKSYHEVRELLGSQASVAKRLGVSERTIQRRENGDMKITREAEIALHSLQAFHEFGTIFKTHKSNGDRPR